MSILLSGTIIIGHSNQGLKHPQMRKTRLGTWAESFPRAAPTSKLGCPKPLQVREAQGHTRPTAQLHGTALSRHCQPWSKFRLVRGFPAEAPRSTGKLHLARDHPRQTMAAAQPPDGTGPGVNRRRPLRRTADMTSVASICSEPCATIPGAMQVCGALCGLA